MESIPKTGAPLGDSFQNGGSSPIDKTRNNKTLPASLSESSSATVIASNSTHWVPEVPPVAQSLRTSTIGIMQATAFAEIRQMLMQKGQGA